MDRQADRSGDGMSSASHTATEGVCIVRVHGPGPRCGQTDIIPAVLVWAESDETAPEAACDAEKGERMNEASGARSHRTDVPVKRSGHRKSTVTVEKPRPFIFLAPPPRLEPLAPLLRDRWTEGDDAELLRLVAQGELWGPIARSFGKDRGECRERYELVQRHAVAGKGRQ